MVHVNDGQFEVEWQEGMTVESLLKACNLIYPALVVSVNGQVVPDQDIASHVVDDDDKVKVRHLVAGG